MSMFLLCLPLLQCGVAVRASVVPVVVDVYIYCAIYAQPLPATVTNEPISPIICANGARRSW